MVVNLVVVPLDGSRTAEAAIPTARSLARSGGVGLHLLHVRRREVERRAATEYLDRTVELIGRGERSKVDYEVRDGNVVECLHEGACRVHANLVVMASRGLGDVRPVGDRSVAEQLAARTVAPLLLVRADAGFPTDEPRPIKRVLAAIDPERDPTGTIRGLVDFAFLSQAHVTLVSVVVDEPPTDQPDPDRRRRTLAVLDRLADRLRADGIRAAARVVAGSDVAASILAELTRCGADVVVVHPKERVRGAAEPFGRVTDAIIRGATTPVLVLPAKATDD